MGGLSVPAVVRKEEGKLLEAFCNVYFIMLMLGFLLNKITSEVTGQASRIVIV